MIKTALYYSMGHVKYNPTITHPASGSLFTVNVHLNPGLGFLFNESVHVLTAARMSIGKTVRSLTFFSSRPFFPLTSLTHSFTKIR